MLFYIANNAILKKRIPSVKKEDTNRDFSNSAVIPDFPPPGIFKGRIPLFSTLRIWEKDLMNTTTTIF